MSAAKLNRRLADALLAVPPAAREALADEAHSVDFAVGGACLFRALRAQALIRLRLGLHVPLVVGGMVYWAGPHRAHDLVAFCGPDNRLRRTADGIMGHWWLQAGPVVVDLSPPDWIAQQETLLAGEAAYFGRSLPPIVWKLPPPRYVWERIGTGTTLEAGKGEPSVGRAFYAREPGLPAGAAEAVRDVEPFALVGLDVAAPAKLREARA